MYQIREYFCREYFCPPPFGSDSQNFSVAKFCDVRYECGCFRHSFLACIKNEFFLTWNTCLFEVWTLPKVLAVLQLFANTTAHIQSSLCIFSGYAIDIRSVFWRIETNDKILLKYALQMALALHFPLATLKLMSLFLVCDMTHMWCAPVLQAISSHLSLLLGAVGSEVNVLVHVCELAT